MGKEDLKVNECDLCPERLDHILGIRCTYHHDP